MQYLLSSLLQFGDSLPATEADVDPTESPTDDGCEAFRDDCNGCVTAPAGCMFVTYKVGDSYKVGTSSLS